MNNNRYVIYFLKLFLINTKTKTFIRMISQLIFNENMKRFIEMCHNIIVYKNHIQSIDKITFQIQKKTILKIMTK
jgi:hypothetical protein